jgi:hypothetical protein
VSRSSRSSGFPRSTARSPPSASTPAGTEATRGTKPLDRAAHIAKNVNATAITLEDAPRGYAEFDAGAAQKYVLNPNGYLDAA